MTLSIGSGEKEFLVAQRNQLVLKPVFLKQFDFLKPLDILLSLLDPFEIGEKGTSAKTVTLRDANEDAVGKVCIVVQKTSDNAGGKPKRGFSLHSTQNI